MGYTHYWYESKKPDEIPPRALSIISEIIQEAYANGIIQREFNNSEPPIVTKENVQFNGVGGDGYESFQYSVKAGLKIGNGKYFSFCKTARLPYDEIVMRVLIVLKWSLDDTFEFHSDGSFSEEWKSARTEMFEKYNIVTSIERSSKID